MTKGSSSLLSRVWSETRSDLVAGGLLVVPLAVTGWLAIRLVRLLDGLAASFLPEALSALKVPGLGIVVAFVLIIAVGAATRYYTGRRVVSFYEGWLSRVPVIRAVYLAFKQLVGSLFSGKKSEFSQVVLVEYPRKQVYALAFVTGVAKHLEIAGEEHGDLLSVFLPTTPNPTSGFYLVLPRSETLELDIGVEEAFKLLMSAGIVQPGGHFVAQRGG